MTGTPTPVADVTAAGTLGIVWRQLLRGNRWLLVVAVIGALSAPPAMIAIHHWIDPLNVSGWEFAGQPLRWLLFAAGVVLGIAMPVVIAHGIARRTFAAAGALYLGVVALAGAAYMAAGYLVEGAVFAAYDLPQVPTDGHLFTDPGRVDLVLAEYGLAFAGYLVSGWLVAVCYYRTSPVRGTLCLPLTLLPIAAVEASLVASTWVLDLIWVVFTGDRPGEVVAPLPSLAGIGLALAAVLAGLVAVRLVTRRMPLRAPGGWG